MALGRAPLCGFNKSAIAVKDFHHHSVKVSSASGGFLFKFTLMGVAVESRGIVAD